MRRSEVDYWTTNHWQHSHRTKTSLAWTCTTDGSPASTTTSIILRSTCRYNRGPGWRWPRTNWRGVIKRCGEVGTHLGRSSVSSSQQTRMASECGPLRPHGCGMNRGSRFKMWLHCVRQNDRTWGCRLLGTLAVGL